MSEDTKLLYEHLLLEKNPIRHISAFVSGTEGVGTSWCALNVAYAINSKKYKTLLVDGNGSFTNINTYLNLNNSLPLSLYTSGNKTLNQLITAYKNRDFNILSDLNGNNSLSELPLGRLYVFANDLQTLSDNYDFTFIDMGNDLSVNNMHLCSIADNIITICSDNNADLFHTFDLIKTINEHKFSANHYLIINKVNSFEDGYKMYEKLNKAAERNNLKSPELLGIIRFDARVRETIRNKDLLQIRYPTSEATVDIHNIARKLLLENDYD